MSDQHDSKHSEGEFGAVDTPLPTAMPDDPNTLSPLPGEPGIPNVAQRSPSTLSRKGLLAVGLLIVSLVAVSALSLQRWMASGKRPGDDPSQRVGNRPAAATAQPRKLEMPSLPTVAASATTTRVPALLPTAEEAEPIGVRRTGAGANPSSGPTSKAPLPEDAPVMLVSGRPARIQEQTTPTGSGDTAPGTTPAAGDPNDPLTSTTRNLQDYQRRLQGLMDSLTRGASLAAPGSSVIGAAGGTPAPSMAPPNGLFGGQLAGSATPRVSASMLGNRSLTLPKGTAFTCALKTKVINAASGLVGCQVQRNVYSDDGRVLLIERGAHLDGEYRIASVRPGTVRIPVLWIRIRTPHGVTVDIDSPGTGPLGESGIEGYVDNRWGERLGAAMLLSLIDDSVKLVIQEQASRSDSSGQGNTVILPATTANTSKLAEKVLDSTINIPPLIYQNQGGLVGIYVARDVDFSSVYELAPVSVPTAAPTPVPTPAPASSTTPR